MVLEYELYNFMFETARIGHENTYDMRGNFQTQFIFAFFSVRLQHFTVVVSEFK